MGEVREDITSYFGLDGESVANLTLSELVVNVTNLAHGKGNVAAMLGGVVLGTKDITPPDEAQQSTGGDPWAEAEGSSSEPAGDPLAPLYEAVEAATSREELKRLWAENQTAFADTSLMGAWKAKGKALSS